MKLEVIQYEQQNYLCHKHLKIGDSCKIRCFGSPITKYNFVITDDLGSRWGMMNIEDRLYLTHQKILCYKVLCKIPDAYVFLGIVSFEAKNIYKVLKDRLKK